MIVPRISHVSAVPVPDSRGIPTIAVTVYTDTGIQGTFTVPSGASTGIHEAVELRDSDGGVSQVCALIATEIHQAIVGMPVTDQALLDDRLCTLDGTVSKSRLGGNTLIGVSSATAVAAAAAYNIPLWSYLHTQYFSKDAPAFPRLYANCINGGKHAHTTLSFQEYHIVPKTNSIHEALAHIAAIQERVYTESLRRYGTVVRGDEGGYALPCSTADEPLALYTDCVQSLGLSDRVSYALDVAASSLYDPDTALYTVHGTTYTNTTLRDLYTTLVATYPLLSIEDPFYEEDFDAFTDCASYIPGVLRIGDDLTTTNTERIQKAIAQDSIDGVIIKPNQIGTLTETIAAIQTTHAAHKQCIISHRSGETEDTFIADLAYASGAFGIKAGARGPKEREAKYTRLLTIEEAV